MNKRPQIPGDKITEHEQNTINMVSEIVKQRMNKCRGGHAMKAQQTHQVDRLAQVEALGSNLARYWTVPVSVIVELGDYALVRRGDGLSFVVERIDLEEGH